MIAMFVIKLVYGILTGVGVVIGRRYVGPWLISVYKKSENHPALNRTQFVRQITNNWRCGFIMSRKYKFELKKKCR